MDIEIKVWLFDMLNAICKIQLRTTQPLYIDSYFKNRTTGSFILIDSFTNETVAAGVVVAP